MVQYKLTYFNTPGFGEPIRFLFHYGGIPFEDYRFSIADWPQIKPHLKHETVPILEDLKSGKSVNESIPIVRFVAKLVKLAGDNDWEALEIESMAENVISFRAKAATYGWETDPEKKKKMGETLFKETIPGFLKKFDKMIEDNNGYFVLGKLTWLDIYFVSQIDSFNLFFGTDSIWKDYSNLWALRNKILQIPNIKKYIENRPAPDIHENFK